MLMSIFYSYCLIWPYVSVLKFTELLVLEIFVPCTVLIYVHALLSRSTNTSETLQVPGLVETVTARDVAGGNGKDEQAYAEDTVFLASGGMSGPFTSVIYKKIK